MTIHWQYSEIISQEKRRSRLQFSLSLCHIAFQPIIDTVHTVLSVKINSAGWIWHLSSKLYFKPGYCYFLASVGKKTPNVSLKAGIRTILSPDIYQLEKFAGSNNSQFVDFQSRTFLSYLFCRVGQFSVRTFLS